MSDSVTKMFADSIRKTRKSLGVTQEQLAEELDITSRAYQEIEYGNSELTLSKHTKIMKILTKMHNNKNALDVSNKDIVETIADEMKRIYIKAMKWL